MFLKFRFNLIKFLEPDNFNPSDEMSWQHYLYSKLGKKDEQMIEETTEKASVDKKGEEKKIEDTVERIVAMAKVLFGLHMVCMSDKSQNLNSATIR